MHHTSMPDLIICACYSCWRLQDMLFNFINYCHIYFRKGAGTIPFISASKLCGSVNEILFYNLAHFGINGFPKGFPNLEDWGAIYYFVILSQLTKPSFHKEGLQIICGYFQGMGKAENIIVQGFDGVSLGEYHWDSDSLTPTMKSVKISWWLPFVLIF
jgi:hypothetical protein